MRPLPLVLAAVALLAAAPLANGTPGAPDTSLGPGGQQLVQDWILKGLGEDDTVFRDLSALSTGELVVLAEERCALGCQADLVVGRVTADGVPLGRATRPGSVVESDDPTRLGALTLSDGRALVAYGEGNGSAGSLLVVGADGSDQGRRELGRPIVPVAELPGGAVLGVVVVGGGPVQLVRVTPDLAIDSSFGVGGVTTVDALTDLAVAAQSGEAIFLAGSARSGPALVRLTVSGQVVAVRGVVRPAWVSRSGPGAVSGMSVRPTGGVVVAVSGVGVRGRGRPTDEIRSFLAAHDARGRPDRAFGRRGAVTLADDRGVHIAVQANGRIVTASEQGCEYTWLEEPECRIRLTLRRFTTAGRLDRSFPTRNVRLRARFFEGWDMELDSAGRVVVAGGGFTTYGRSGLLLARFLTR